MVMSESEREKPEEAGACGSIEGGFTVYIDEKHVGDFMQAGDYSSSVELHHFESITEKIEQMVRGSENKSILACSLPEDRTLRDFAVLQIAHIMSKHNKEVLIVDCDFLSPGLSGIIEDVEEHGFLDLLLYGSSLKSISRDIGIDGVKVIGPGSFPVSRTIPFAMKEFDKINIFLTEKSDVVIYCSTVYTEDGKLNPLCREINQAILFCQIDRLEDGELKKHIDSLRSEGVAHAEIVCFCQEEAGIAAAIPQDEVEEDRGEHVSEEAQYIEKTSEVSIEAKEGHSRLPWIITSVVAVLIVVFVTWWFLNYRAIKQNEARQRMTEVVQKKTESRSAAMEKKEEGGGVPVASDTVQLKVMEGKTVPVSRPEKEVPETGKAEVTGSSMIERQGYYYTVHVASFQDIARAGREIDYLEKNGFDAFIVDALVKDKTWFRVLVGKFATKEEADEVRLDLLELKRVGYARVIKQKIKK